MCCLVQSSSWFGVLKLRFSKHETSLSKARNVRCLTFRHRWCNGKERTCQLSEMFPKGCDERSNNIENRKFVKNRQILKMEPILESSFKLKMRSKTVKR